MALTCMLGFHSWDGSKCSKCGKIRDSGSITVAPVARSVPSLNNMEKEIDDALGTLNKCLELCKAEILFIPKNSSAIDKAILLKKEYPKAKEKIFAGLANMSSDFEQIGASAEEIRKARSNDTNLMAMSLSLVEGTIKKLGAA